MFAFRQEYINLYFLIYFLLENTIKQDQELPICTNV